MVGAEFNFRVSKPAEMIIKMNDTWHCKHSAFDACRHKKVLNFDYLANTTFSAVHAFDSLYDYCRDYVSHM
jgi:hypothetical protein